MKIQSLVTIGTLAATGLCLTAVQLPAAPLPADPSSASAIERQARFRLDRDGYLKQYETVFERPILKGFNAVAVGNGDLAAVTWQPDHLTWMLNKCDISGEASQAARLTIETPDKIAERRGRLETRLSLAEARVAIKYTGGEFGESKGWGWRGLNSAAPEPRDADMGSVEAAAFVPKGRNCLLVEYAEAPKVPHPTTIVFERWLQSSRGGDAAAVVAGNTLAITYRLTDGSSYAAVLAYDGFEGAVLAKAGPLRTTLTLPATPSVRGRLAIAVVTSHEASDPLAAATELAQTTLAAAPAKVRADNRGAWDAFWGRSFVSAGHPYVNALYLAGLYELGITSGGSRPVKFNGALNLWNEADRAWGSPYYCHNQSEVYLSLYAANHGDLADNFHDWISRARPEAVKAARKSFGIAGAYYPEVMEHDFKVVEPDKLVKPTDDMAYILSSGTRYALMMWNRYRYSLDQPFLAGKAYPVIRDVAEFYTNYGKLGADGLYHVGPAMAWEERPVGRDAHSDCAAWRAIFPIAIEAATKLGVDEDKVTVWRERLSKAPPFPIDRGRFSVVTRNDGTPEPADHFQWQMPNLSGVFPYSVIGLGSSEAARKTAAQTFDAYRYNADAGHEFLPVVAARLGNPEGYRAALFQYLQYFQMFDQGLSHYYNLVGIKELGTAAEAAAHPYLEASGIIATSVNESLLQSYDGVIRVFPALPGNWHGRFILKAAGSFLVCSERRGSGTPYILVQPVAGAARNCRVSIPWKQGAELGADGAKVPFQVKNGAAEFMARPGVVYTLTPKGTKLSDVPLQNEGFNVAYSPSRLGNCWYGNREGQNNHTSSFPLW